MTVRMGLSRSQEPLTGPQKSAVLCIALGPEVAAQMLQRLSPEEVEQVTREIAAMPKVDTNLVKEILQEYQSASRTTESVARGGVAYAEQVLEQALGATRARSVLERVRERVADTGLKRLSQAPPEILANILRGEHPQTIALILAHLDVRRAGGVIEVMNTDQAADVLFRIACMEKVSPEMLALVETGLGSKTDLSLSQEMTLSGGPAAVAQLLNRTAGTLEKQLLEAISQRNADMATQIKNLMFVFEDLLLLDGKSVQRVLREVDGKELALALKAASPELKQHIRSNMSERAGGALEEEIEMLGPVRVREVEAAHTRIIEIVRSLEEAGEILVRGRGGNDDIIG